MKIINRHSVHFIFAFLILTGVSVATIWLIWSYALDPWMIASCILFLLIIITLSFIFVALRNNFPLHGGGPGFEESGKFNEKQKAALKQHYLRMEGTLKFWKNRALLFGWIQKSTVLWSITTAVLIPIIIQFYDQNKIWARIFVTGLSTFSALLIAVNRGFKAEQLYQAYRVGESKFYDLMRKLLDNPENFGETAEDQISEYFKIAEEIRLETRRIEVDSQPSSDPIQ